MFALGVPLCLIGLAVSFFMPEYPLRDQAAVGLADHRESDPAVAPMH